MKITYSSGGSRIFPRGGRQLPKWVCLFIIFAENCMKMKEFGPPGGVRVPGAPPWIRQCIDIVQLLFTGNKEKAPQSACNYSRETVTVGEILMLDRPGFVAWEFKRKLHGDGTAYNEDRELNDVLVDHKWVGW